jgi:hypothetical protein
VVFFFLFVVRGPSHVCGVSSFLQCPGRAMLHIYSFDDSIFCFGSFFFCFCFRILRCCACCLVSFLILFYLERWRLFRKQTGWMTSCERRRKRFLCAKYLLFTSMLSDVTENGINANLKKRYAKDIIYTYIGPVLISVNPFKNIPDLYSDRLLKDYRGKYPYEMQPHVYALADQIYRQLMQEGKPQAVVISGESGAGKTEASKKILQYIAVASSGTPDVQRVKVKEEICFFFRVFFFIQNKQGCDY